MNNKALVILKKGRDEAIRRYHQWVFSGAIDKIKGKVEEGSIVDVLSSEGNFLGTGHYNDGSIAVRLLSFEKTDLSLDFWIKRFQNAYYLRKSLKLTDSEETNTYRLIYGEGDGLPGLIVDYYAGIAVIQCHSFGIYLQIDLIAEALKKVLSNSLRAIYCKSRETLPEKFRNEINDGIIWGSIENSIVIKENNILFHLDLEKGQKTGFFIDQRENRVLVEKFSKNKTVLNTFCYTGGFSVYALRGGAVKVHSVDSSSNAVALAESNLLLNNFTSGENKCIRSDVTDYLKNSDDNYDIIILDPPAYAKHLKDRHKALQAYKRLNETAIKKIKNYGFLFTFSCSQAVDANLFKSAVVAAAIDSRRKIRIVNHLGQPPDHPVSAFHPEGEYLKGLLLYIE